VGRYGSAALKLLDHACTLSATTALSRSCFLATSMSTIAHFPCSRSQRQPWRGRPLGGAANWTEHWPLERTQAHTISPALGLGGVCGATVMLRLLRAQVSQRRASCRHGAEKLGLRVPPAVPATAAAVCRGYACKTDAS
jgi:hypothetical protein